MTTNNPSPNITPERIMQFAWGYAPTLIIAAALEHKLFDALEKSSRTVSELAGETGTSTRGLTAILDALVGLQLLSKSGDRYALAPESAAFLISTKTAFQGALFKHQVASLIPNWLHLSDAVRTGKPAQAVNEAGESAEFFAGFVEAIFPLSYQPACALGEHLGIPRLTKPASVLDIAAGSGVWSIALAKQSPHVHISVVDWPKVLEVTKKVAAKHGVADRLTLIPGDILEAPFGSGHQIATLGHILHSEGADRSRQLLRKVFAALAPGGTIAIAEFTPNDDRTGPPMALIFSVNMLVNTDEGATFTFAEISQWLQVAGFVNPRQFDAGGVSPLILATKP